MRETIGASVPSVMKQGPNRIDLLKLDSTAPTFSVNLTWADGSYAQKHFLQFCHAGCPELCMFRGCPIRSVDDVAHKRIRKMLHADTAFALVGRMRL